MDDMDDDEDVAGGNDEPTPAERRMRARFTARPPRTGMIWFVSLTLGALGLLTLYIGAYVYADLNDHGEDGPELLVPVLVILTAVVEIACGIGLFAGAGWSRNWARGVCIATLVGGLWQLLNGASPVSLLILALFFVLLVALSGERVRDWCA